VITLALEHAHILQRREGEVYVHYVALDKRMDEWVSEEAVKPVEEGMEVSSSSHRANGRKRKRDEANYLESSSPARYRSVDFAVDDDYLVETQGEVSMTEEDFDIQHHKQITAQRNFDKVNFGHWQMKTWCVACTVVCPRLKSRQVLLTIPSDGIRN
jgi:histone acetyltransferase MYST1